MFVYNSGGWRIIHCPAEVVCPCEYDCGRCHRGTAKSQKKARKSAEAKWREIVGAEKAAQVKPEPGPVPVDAPTRPVQVEIVRPDREVPVKQIAQGEHFVSGGRVFKVTVVVPGAKYVAWVDLESGKAGTIYHLAMVEPCTIERTERIVATVTT